MIRLFSQLGKSTFHASDPFAAILIEMKSSGFIFFD